MFLITCNTLCFITYYLATSCDLEYRSSGYCTRTWMCSEISIWMHSCSCGVAWWWLIFKVKTSYQTINNQKECLVCDWKYQYTFAFRLLPTPLAQYTRFSSPFFYNM